jgi:hypothetical protein
VEGNTSVLNKNWMRNIRTSINILDKESRGRAEDKMQKRNVNL